MHSHLAAFDHVTEGLIRRAWRLLRTLLKKASDSYGLGFELGNDVRLVKDLGGLITALSAVLSFCVFRWRRWRS